MPRVDPGKGGGNPGNVTSKGALDKFVQQVTKSVAKPNSVPRNAGRETQPDHPPQKRRTLRNTRGYYHCNLVARPARVFSTMRSIPPDGVSRPT